MSTANDPLNVPKCLDALIDANINNNYFSDRRIQYSYETVHNVFQ